MLLVFLPSTARDLEWFRYYYNSVFPDGDVKAKQHFRATKQLLAENPYIGRAVGGYDDVRELVIPRTPFTVIYRVNVDQIEVLRVWDRRQGGV